MPPIGPHKDLLTVVNRCKLKWYGRISRSSGLAQTILHGTVKGGRRQGRQKKRWKDNIREWTGLEFAMSQRAVENREKWRKLVVRSSAVPQQTLQLRDRRRWRWRCEGWPTKAKMTVSCWGDLTLRVHPTAHTTLSLLSSPQGEHLGEIRASKRSITNQSINQSINHKKVKQWSTHS